MTANTTRSRILTASEQLFRRQGYAGAGLNQIVKDAKAPLGSLYHFFPGGKQQLCTEVITSSGRAYAALIPAIFDVAPDPATGVRSFFGAAATVVEASGYQDACPIAVIALEVASTSEPLREATHEVFTSWVDLLSGYFVAAGIDGQEAHDLAVFCLATLEGAFMLARASRDIAPMTACGRLAEATVRRALPDMQGRSQ